MSKQIRDTKLPAGWKWIGRMTVSNGTENVYLTSGLHEEKQIREHINKVMADRAESRQRQAALA